MFLGAISKNVCFSVLVCMYVITEAHNASTHMVDFRKQEILIETERDKLFVINIS